MKKFVCIIYNIVLCKMASAVENVHLMPCCVCGYHVYSDIWGAVDGEVLSCEQEAGNVMNRFALAVKKNGTVIGHAKEDVTYLLSLPAQ